MPYGKRSFEAADAIQAAKEHVIHLPRLRTIQQLRKKWPGLSSARWRAMIRSLVVNGIDSVE